MGLYDLRSTTRSGSKTLAADKIVWILSQPDSSILETISLISAIVVITGCCPKRMMWSDLKTLCSSSITQSQPWVHQMPELPTTLPLLRKTRTTPDFFSAL